MVAWPGAPRSAGIRGHAPRAQFRSESPAGRSGDAAAVWGWPRPRCAVPADVGGADLGNIPLEVRVSFHQNKQCSGRPLPASRAANPADQAGSDSVARLWGLLPGQPPECRTRTRALVPGIREVWAFL